MDFFHPTIDLIAYSCLESSVIVDELCNAISSALFLAIIIFILHGKHNPSGSDSDSKFNSSFPQDEQVICQNAFQHLVTELFVAS